MHIFLKRGTHFFFVIVLALTGFYSVIGHAADSDSVQSHRDNIEQLLVAMGVPEQVNQSAAEVRDLYLVKVDENKADDQVKKMVGDYRQEINDLVANALSWDAVKSYYISVYAKQMTVAEIEAVMEFIYSPVGKKFVAGQGIANQEIREILKVELATKLTEPVRALSSDLRDALTEHAKKLKNNS